MSKDKPVKGELLYKEFYDWVENGPASFRLIDNEHHEWVDYRFYVPFTDEMLEKLEKFEDSIDWLSDADKAVYKTTQKARELINRKYDETFPDHEKNERKLT